MERRYKLVVGILLTHILGFILLLLGINYSFNHNMAILQTVLNVLVIALMGLFLVSAAIVWLIATGKGPLVQRWIFGLLRFGFNFFYSSSCFTARILKIELDVIHRFFAEINNAMVINKGLVVNPEEILILAPHCLQWSNCRHRITNSVDNCTMCGKCLIKDMVSLAKKYGVCLKVVSGGTQARRVVYESSPGAVIAIACERDLMAGIKEADGIPVVGICNVRPKGPCTDTMVDLGLVERHLKQLTKGVN
ncbi:MAG TPA: DUF116 domain-containing protein [Clostridiales bacterium]|nr:DUF116 domain-containing protein [Clostridiales bacterium]